MDLKDVVYLLILGAIAIANSCSAIKLLPSILWHPKNHLFACNENKNLTINARINDVMHFVCPFSNEYGHSILPESVPFITDYYEKIYFVDEEDFVNCDTTNGELFYKCDKPDILKIKKEKFSDNGGKYKMMKNIVNKGFVAGNNYYLITTSNSRKEGIDQTKGGLCVPSADNYALKLILHICEYNDEDCACDDTSCYEQQCSVWNEWRTIESFHWNGTKCLQKYTRDCKTTKFKCVGERTKFEVTSSKEKCKIRTQIITKNFTIPPITPYSHVTKTYYSMYNIILTVFITGLFVFQATILYIQLRLYNKTKLSERGMNENAPKTNENMPPSMKNTKYLCHDNPMYDKSNEEIRNGGGRIEEENDDTSEELELEIELNGQNNDISEFSENHINEPEEKVYSVID